MQTRLSSRLLEKQLNMQHVYIGQTQNDILIPLLTLRLRNGIVEFDGDAQLTETLREGVVDTQGNILTPDDGYLFLVAVSRQFDHPSLVASDVIEG